MRHTITALLTIVALCCGTAYAAHRKARPRVLRMQATAFCQDAKPTASVTVPHEGIVAADPSVLPLGTRIRIAGAGSYDGIYIVTDTGSKIVGRHVDLYVPTRAEAKQFGKKTVRVQILETGDGKEDARQKDIPAASAKR